MCTSVAKWKPKSAHAQIIKRKAEYKEAGRSEHDGLHEQLRSVCELESNKPPANCSQRSL